MIKKVFITVTLTLLSIASFAANLVGTWDIRNYNDMGKDSEKANLMFGILGESKSIEFKSNGTFYCNDTVYGTYTSKGTELILVRDQKLVEAFKEKLKEVADEEKKEFLNGYDCDSLKLSFTKEGNKALAEINQHKDVLKLLPFGIAFELTKQGTNGKNEDLNAGKTIIGKYSLNIMGMMNMDCNFKKGGDVDMEVGMFGQSQKVKGKYAIKGKELSIIENGKESMKGEYIISSEGFYLMVKKDDKTIAMMFWKE